MGVPRTAGVLTRFRLAKARNCKDFCAVFAFRLQSRLGAPERGVPAKREGSGVAALQLAYEFESLLDAGVVNTRADIARRCGISRARVSQAMSLLRLAESVRDHIAGLPLTEQRRYTERRLREIAAAPAKEMQLEAFARLREALGRTDRERSGARR
jgi:hypothetical protein